MKLSFEKYEGLGNDFLVVDTGDLSAEDAMALCDRHLGVGGDGVLFTGLSNGEPFMRVINADGSTPEMCGNGLRCVALFLVLRGHVGTRAFEVKTDAGPHAVEVLSVDGDRAEVRVGMRPASLTPSRLPLRSETPWIDHALDVDGIEVRLTAVSMGNPHAVTFDPLEARRRVLGPALETDAHFPERVNVGFAQVTDEGLTLDVWERGCGWTQACGTGACAAAVAAVETGRAERGRDLRVTLPGGPMTIRVEAPDAPVWMTGPARRVFAGEVDVPERRPDRP
ncbi:MAG: diaminopimelate epimerase [Sandaracinaceae bacterium]